MMVTMALGVMMMVVMVVVMATVVGDLCRMRSHVMATHMTAEMKEDATESSKKSNLIYTPLYNKTILGRKRHPAGIFVFGRFLVRLSESDHSQVLSMASFFCAHSN